MYKTSIFKRLVSLALCLVLVASCLPAGVLTTASAVEGLITTDTEADPSTLNSWRDTSFNPFDLTTEHAGGVWTDKTVVKAGDADTVFVDKDDNPLGITAGANNFLVALSALGANSVVAGRGSTPTDTIFVLDVSNSMENTDLREMVTAANDAIHSLLTANSDNRVGVVVYSTNVNVLLPLDRYTPVEKGYGNNRTTAYIEMSNNYGQIRAARTGFGGNATYVKNSSGDDVTTSIDASGATYIQGGLWRAYQMFNDATVSDTRTPVLVLMSDGAPSYGTKDYNDVSSRDVGNGGTGSITDGLAFLTQLTAAYVKEKIADKYNTDAYFYSVGLGVSEGGQNVSIAEAVLDTSKTREDPEDWWTTYLGLANKTTKTMSFNAAGKNVTVTYDSTITSASKAYVNGYFPAEDASQLSSAFQGIVNEINLKASYNVTRIEGAEAHSGGYVTFVDEIGTGMEVKDIKGILVGDTLYTGQRLAQALLNSEFGTAEEPTTLGDNMVWALKQRLGITDMVMDTETGPVTITATERVHDLIRQAYDAGQIAYNANTGAFSNLICWFSDANGDYLGFWDHDDPNCVIPEGAAYANASYGMLGTTTDSQTAHASDMMYVAVMVSKQVTQVGGQPALEAKTPEMVTFRVPAALLPTVTYQIEVKAATGEAITEDTPATITYNEAEPIRLVYEVGVNSQLTPENIKDFLRPNYQAKDANGNYYLYTNAWYWDGADESDWNIFENHPDKGDEVLYDTSKNHITYAYFEPNEQNEHYYYTENTELYTYNGTSYEKLTTAPVTDGSVTYYYQHKTYTSIQTAVETGVAVDAKVNIHYGEVSQKLLADSNNYAVDATSGVYYIKEGTMHYHSIHEHDKVKTENATGSFGYRLHQLVDIAVTGQNTASHHYEIMYLGNNGRITYSPAQGFTLSKVMAAGSTAEGEFTFDVTVSSDSDGKYTETVNGVSTEKALTNNAFTVSLAAGEQVTITGIDAGATYTVTEQEREGYKLGGIVVSAGSASGATATGTVVENQIHSVTYTNDIQEYGSLLVTKDVTYNKGSQLQNVSHTFRITVELTGMAGKQVYVDGVPTVLDGNGKTVLMLKDDGQALITGIPEGTAYTVTEDTSVLTKGYAATADTFTGGIVKNAVATAAVQNAYTPDDIVLTSTEPQISIDITKKYYLYNGVNGNLFNQSRTFEFELLKYDTAISDWVPVTVNGATVKTSTTFTNPNTNEDPAEGTTTNTDILLNMAGVTLNSVGTHYFRVAEVIPEAAEQKAGMTYDRTFHDFEIVVTDADLDGKLEISDVNSLQNANVSDPVDADNDGVAEHWNVSTEFFNSEITHSTKLTIEAIKKLEGATLKDGQFTFALYKANYNETENTFVTTGDPITAKNGAKGDIIFTSETYPFISGDTYYYYVMKETSTDGNGVTTDKTVWEIMVEVYGSGSGNAEIKGIKYRKQGETSWSGQVTGAPADNVFNAITFTNTYKADPTNLILSGGKTLTNLTPGMNNAAMTVPADKYSFTLSAVTAGAPMPANATVFAAQGGAVSFGQIEFKNADTYVYKLVENDTGVSGVSYDPAEYTITVVVTDNGLGQLVAEATYTKDGIPATGVVFNNTYTAAPVTGLKIHANKVLNVDAAFDRPLMANDFRATLTHPDGTTETVFNDANGIFQFAPLSFDAVGTYNYSISELIPQGAVNNKLDGVTYDAAVKEFTIEVTDNSNDQLVAKLNGTQTLSSTSQLAATIENAYAADPAPIHLVAHKDLEGRDLGANEFSFKIEAITTGAPMPTTPVVRNSEEGDVDFGTITYNAVGVYQYKVTEQKLDENGDPIAADPATGEYIYKGVTYSVKVYTVTVTVTDLRNGQLIAHVSSVDQNSNPQPGGIVFTNVYQAAPVEAEITATKELYDLTGGANDKLTVPADTYKFKLEALNGAPAPANSEVFAAVGGAVSFGKIEYTAAGVYSYTLTEIDTNVPGVESDPAVYTVEVEIEDDLLGSLQVKEIRYIKDRTSNTSAVFTNKYSAESTEAEIAAMKRLFNQTPGVDETVMTVPADTYKFKLERVTADAPMPAQAEVFAAAGGAVSFGKVEYTKAGVYKYKLTEIDMQVPGVDSDDTVYTVTVTIVDDGAGQLNTVSVVYSKGTADYPAAVFDNYYTAGAVTVNIEGDSAKTDGKIFTDESSLSENKKDLDDYAFEFVLAKLDGTVIETVTDNGAGFEFKNITYSEVGQTQYLIYEKPTGKAGVTYDSAKYRVTVTVTDGGNGLLEATVKYEKAESSESGDYETVSGVLFENTYKAKETSVTFGGKKTLTGRELKENDFSFTLKTASGEEIETVKNDAEGIFCFKTVTYYNEGTFTYTLEEVKGNAEGITYDDAKYTLTVTVTDVEGELKATTEIRKDGKVADSVGFTNIYTPKAPEPTEPSTEAPTEAPTEPPTEAPTEAPTEPAPEGGAQVPPNDDPGNTGTNSGNENIDIPEDEPPKTGDDSHVGRWTLMMAVSAIGVLAVLVLGKKKLFEQ